MTTGQKTVFINARIVDPASGLDARGSLLVEDGIIADWTRTEASGVPTGIPGGAEVIDCAGAVLCPGLIDMRVFTGEPGAEQKETLASASEAAAAGGVTTMVVMPRTNPVIDDASLVDFILRRARDTAVVRVLPMAAITRGLKGSEITEMGLLAEAGAVGFTDAGQSVSDARLFRGCLAYAKTFSSLIMHDAQEPALTREGTMHESELATRLGLNGIPDAAETIMVERDMALLGLTGARYHLAQVSGPASLEALDRARDQGLPITCSVSAHHLTLNEIDIANYRTFLKVLPPLRSEDHRRGLVDALAQGRIDVIVSSHEPQPPEDKRLPFGEAAFGAVGLETLLPAALEVYHNGHMTLPKLLATMTVRPAEILGLPGGRIAKGLPADLALIDVGAPFVLNGERLRSRSRNTPFHGRRFQGRVLRTVVGGRTVFDANRANRSNGADSQAGNHPGADPTGAEVNG